MEMEEIIKKLSEHGIVIEHYGDSIKSNQASIKEIERLLHEFWRANDVLSLNIDSIDQRMEENNLNLQCLSEEIKELTSKINDKEKEKAYKDKLLSPFIDPIKKKWFVFAGAILFVCMEGYIMLNVQSPKQEKVIQQLTEKNRKIETKLMVIEHEKNTSKR